MNWPEDYINKIICGDCLEVMKGMPEGFVDAVITDSPYGLKFMGKKWDYDVPGIDKWRECFRVLKPGGFLLSFFGTRTYHRGVVNIEDAGFEIRDQIGWLYGSGFPKSLDVSKAIDKAAGCYIPGDILPTSRSVKGPGGYHMREKTGTNPQTSAACQWNGWGTALKPAWEPIVVARKPIEGTVAENVLKYGTGGMNIDACRVAVNTEVDDPRLGGKGTWASDKMAKNVYGGGYAGKRVGSSPQGRWPANIIHDGSEEVMERFPQSAGQQGDLIGHKNDRESPHGCYGKMTPAHDHLKRIENEKSAARFFYCAKASKSDRGEGNNHPTVKPTALMRYLCRLVTPPGGIILDPFAGSGSTGKAAMLEGFRFICIDDDFETCEIARKRVAQVAEQQDLFRKPVEYKQRELLTT